MQNRLWLGIAALLAGHAAPLAAQTGDQVEAPLERHHIPPDELLAELNQVVAYVPRSGLTEELAGRLIELGRQLEEDGRAADACRALASFGDTPWAVADLAEELRRSTQDGSGGVSRSGLMQLVHGYRISALFSDLCAALPASELPPAMRPFAADLQRMRTAVSQSLAGIQVRTAEQRRDIYAAAQEAASDRLDRTIQDADDDSDFLRQRLNRQLRATEPGLAATLLEVNYRSLKTAAEPDPAATANAGIAYLRALMIAGDRESALRVQDELRTVLPDDPATILRVNAAGACLARLMRDQNADRTGCSDTVYPTEHCYFTALRSALNDAAREGIPPYCPEVTQSVFNHVLTQRLARLSSDRSPDAMLRLYLTDHAANTEPPDERWILPDPLNPQTTLWRRIRPGATGAEPDVEAGLFSMIQGFNARPVISSSTQSNVDIDLALAIGREAAAAAGAGADYDRFIAQIEAFQDLRIAMQRPSLAPTETRAVEPAAALSGPLQSVGNAGRSVSISGDEYLALMSATPSQRTSLLARAEADARRTSEALAARVPGWNEIVSVEPVRLDTARRLLRPDEALILVDTRHYGTTTIVVTAESQQVHVSNWNRFRMERAVERLTWELGAQSVPQGSTVELMWDSLSEQGRRYSAGLAHDLYAQTIGPLAATLADKRHLIVVANGPAQRLPFSTLVSRPPAAPTVGGAELSNTRWLIDDFAISHLPSVRAFQLLRRRAPASPPAAPGLSFVGIGMTGGASAADADPAANECQLTRGEGRALALRMRTANETRYASPFDLRDALPALPCVRTELNLVASALEGANVRIVTGEQANEAFIRSRDVSSANLLLFSTHGLTARPASGLNESALVLHPVSNEPAADGLLTSSEIAALTLTAEWVILSACNSGTGSRANSPPLEGLSQAFFLAGARSLLVSFWPVVDDVAPRLTAAAVAAVRRGNGAVSRAGALRDAMIAVRNRVDALAIERNYAHPSRWASFTLIGD